MSENLIQVIAVEGDPITLDASDKACEPFGFKHGDRVAHHSAGNGTVMGVARSISICSCKNCRTKKPVLWVKLDNERGVSYSSLNNWQKI